MSRILHIYYNKYSAAGEEQRGARKELYPADSEVLKSKELYIYICIRIYIHIYIYIGELDSLVNQLYKMHAGSENTFKAS